MQEDEFFDNMSFVLDLHLQPPRERVPQNGCGHFVWYDREMDDRAKEVINELKEENKRLKQENKELRRVADRFTNVFSPHESIEEIREDVRLLKQDNMASVEKMRMQLRIAYITILFSLCLIVFFFSNNILDLVHIP